MIKVNGVPISLLQPEILKLKTFEPVLLVGTEKFGQVDIRVRVKGGGTTAQIYHPPGHREGDCGLLPEVRR